MRVSLKWLKEFVDVDFLPRILAERLTMAGLPVVGIERPEGIRDTILELEIPSNRPDCLSIRGIAREVAAITRKRVQLPKEKLREGSTPVSKWASVSLQDEKRCPRYCARVVTGLTLRPSPKWLTDRLKALAIRPVNILVDITNYVLMEYGQPLHAFDLDKLEGKRIVVRRAREGESLTTLDGKKHALNPRILVIADSKKPVALAGIMGGMQTEITPGTRNVLIESACFDPVSVRRAARHTKLSSESSYRFERGVDIGQVDRAADRAAGLMAELAGGRVARGMIDLGTKRARLRRVSLWPRKVDALLGAEIPRKRVSEILTGLGITVLKRERDRLWLNIPSWRTDLTRPVDLTEEVARLWGYDRVPSTLPQLRVDRASRAASDEAVWKVKEHLSAAGLREIMTYALLNRKSLQGTGSSRPDKVLSVRNPRSLEQEVLRPTLCAGLLQSASHNINRRILDFGFFEVGKVYYAQGEGRPLEELMLGIILSGSLGSDWATRPRPYTLFDLKGLFERVCACLQRSVSMKAVSGNGIYAAGSALMVEAEGQEVGTLGVVSDATRMQFDIKHPLWVGELNMERLLSRIGPEGLTPRTIRVPPRLPAINYDVSLIADEGHRAQEVARLMATVGDAALASSNLDVQLSVTLFDHYQGKNIPRGKRSLSYSLHFQPRRQTLVEADAKKVYEAICAQLVEKMGVEIRRS